MERTGIQLEFEGYAQEIIGVMQGIIVLCVVIAYEIVRRQVLRRQQREVGEELSARASGGPGADTDGADDPGTEEKAGATA